MGKTTGFMDYSRELAPRRPVAERVNDWFEIYQDFPEEKLRKPERELLSFPVDSLMGFKNDAEIRYSPNGELLALAGEISVQV